VLHILSLGEELSQIVPSSYYIALFTSKQCIMQSMVHDAFIISI